MSANPLRLIEGKSQREKAIEIARKHRPDMMNLKSVRVDEKTILWVAKDRDPEIVKKTYQSTLEHYARQSRRHNSYKSQKNT